MRGGDAAHGFMQVKLLRRWQGMYEGSVLDLGDGVARALIARGVAEPHDGSPGAANKSMSTEQRAKAVRKKVAG